MKNQLAMQTITVTLHVGNQDDLPGQRFLQPQPRVQLTFIWQQIGLSLRQKSSKLEVHEASEARERILSCSLQMGRRRGRGPCF